MVSEMIIITPTGLEIHYEKGVKVPLPLPRSIYMEAGSMGRVDHQLSVRCERQSVLKSPPDRLFDTGAIVATGIVEDGPLVTLVFNLNTTPLRLSKGAVVAWLVEL